MENETKIEEKLDSILSRLDKIERKLEKHNVLLNGLKKDSNYCDKNKSSHNSHADDNQKTELLKNTIKYLNDRLLKSTRYRTGVIFGEAQDNNIACFVNKENYPVLNYLMNDDPDFEKYDDCGTPALKSTLTFNITDEDIANNSSLNKKEELHFNKQYHLKLENYFDNMLKVLALTFDKANFNARMKLFNAGIGRFSPLAAIWL